MNKYVSYLIGLLLVWHLKRNIWESRIQKKEHMEIAVLDSTCEKNEYENITFDNDTSEQVNMNK